MKAQFFNEHCNKYSVTYNEVHVQKNWLNITSLKVKVFLFFNTSLKVKVLKLLLKYSNALLLLRYCRSTTLTSTYFLVPAPSFYKKQLYIWKIRSPLKS